MARRGTIIVDADDYTQVRRATRGFSRELDRELRKALKDSGQIGAKAVKDKVRSVPTAGGRRRSEHRRHGSGTRTRTRGLRSVLAANTRTQVRSKDVRIVQGARGISGRNARGLPRRLNQAAPFTHPVYGRGRAWQASWQHFDEPIMMRRERMLMLVQQALRDAVRRIDA